MQEIICKSQAELDAVPTDFGGRVIIKFGTHGNPAVINRRLTYSVVAYDTSSVVARSNSSVVAWGNSSVCRRSKYADIAATGNSREVCPPRTITEYAEFYGLPIDNELKTIKLYKAVHRQSGESYFFSDWDRAFKYVIGETITPSDFDADATQLCGPGINLAHKAWAADYGQNWCDLAILECECKCDEVLVPEYTDGKVRAKRAKVLREVPLEECGLLGKMIAKRMAKNEA